MADTSANKLSDIIQTSLENVRSMVDANTIIGNPINTPDGITVIPISKVSFGFGSGGGTGSKATGRGTGYMGGNGAGVKVDPIGFLIIKDGACRMLNIAPPPGTSVERVVEMVPDVLDKIESFINKHSGPRE